MDESNTDWMLTEFDIQQQFVINIAYISILAPDLAAEGNPDNAAAIMVAIRRRLLQPRRSLSFMVNGREMIPSIAGQTGTVDARNGPTPKACNIVALNNVTFLVNYHIVAHYWENSTTTIPSLNTTNMPGNMVLSNRWNETVDMDDCMVSTRTREGKFVIRSDNQFGLIADQARNYMGVLGVPTGFLRQSSRYTVSPDGLAIQYRLVDKEYFKVPPPPAYSASGTYTETTTNSGAIRWGEVRISLKGTNSRYVYQPTSGGILSTIQGFFGGGGRLGGIYVSDQAALVTTAIAVGTYKMWLNGAANTIPGSTLSTIPSGSTLAAPGFSLLKHASIRIGMWENTVDFNMLVQMTGIRQRLAGVPLGTGVIGPSSTLVYTPYSDEVATPPPVYMSRGTAGILLQAAAYYDPSLTRQTMGPGDAFQTEDNIQLDSTTSQLQQGLKVGQAGFQKEI